MELKGKAQRNSTVELLRIFSILLILLFHFAFKSNFQYEKDLNLLHFGIKTLWLLGELGVNLFVLISGYYLVNGRFRWKKVILLIFQILFYHLAGAAVLKLVGVQVPVREFVFPIIRGTYWFATAYLLLYLFSPYLNIMLCNMTETQYRRFLLLSLIVYSLIPTAMGMLLGVERILYYNRLIFMVIVYSIGGYLRLYPLHVKKIRRKALALSALSFLFMQAWILLVLAFPGFFQKLHMEEPAYFWPPNTVPMILTSVGIFAAVLNTHIPYSKWINTLAGTTFGIYLLHDGILAEWLYGAAFNCQGLAGPFDYGRILLLWVCTIFTAGVCIDLIRKKAERFTVIPVLNMMEGLKTDRRSSDYGSEDV